MVCFADGPGKDSLQPGRDGDRRNRRILMFPEHLDTGGSAAGSIGLFALSGKAEKGKDAPGPAD